jgi:hypothetical protein
MSATIPVATAFQGMSATCGESAGGNRQGYQRKYLQVLV